MKKLKIDPNKFRLLTEYTFIDDQDSSNMSDYLLLDDDLNEADEVEIADEMPTDDSETQDTPDIEDSEDVDLSSDINVEDEPQPEAEPEPEAPSEPLMGDEPEAEPADDNIELDVTELVSGLDKTNNLALKAAQGVADLSDKIERLASSLDNMSAINSRIDNIEKEIIKRNPTQKEKLEMRSLDSYPYNLKLTDFWGTNGNTPNSYVKTDDGVPTSNEYILTQNDIDSDYNEGLISKSFNYSDEEDE